MEKTKKIGSLFGKGRILTQPLNIIENGKLTSKIRVSFDILKIQTTKKDFDFNKKVFTLSISNYIGPLIKGESIYLLADLIEKKSKIIGGTHQLIYGEIKNDNNSLIIETNEIVPPWFSKKIMPNMN